MFLLYIKNFWLKCWSFSRVEKLSRDFDIFCRLDLVFLWQTVLYFKCKYCMQFYESIFGEITMLTWAVIMIKETKNDSHIVNFRLFIVRDVFVMNDIFAFWWTNVTHRQLYKYWTKLKIYICFPLLPWFFFFFKLWPSHKDPLEVIQKCVVHC